MSTPKSPLPSSIPALVTGASSGLGVEFARQLAERGHDVTLVARRKDRLETLASELEKHFKVATTVLVADLESPAGRSAVVSTLGDGRAWIVVNNAGFGTHGRYAELEPAREIAEVMLNVVAVEELTAAAVRACVPARSGGVINVASTAAFQPIPYMATYAATKAFVLSFTEALALELDGSGVRMLAFCPGPVDTEFSDVARNGHVLTMRNPMAADAVVRTALRAFELEKTICVPGRRNAVSATGVRFLPRIVLRRVVGKLFKPA